MEKKQELIELLLNAFFKHQLQIKMYHFQTKKYSGHKSSDKYLDKFRENLDQFMEVAQGAFGKLKITDISINFETLNDENIFNSLDKFIEICKLLDKHFKNYTELLNIRDQMTADAEQLKYLLTFN